MQNVETTPKTGLAPHAGNGFTAEPARHSFLDRALVSFLRWDGEKLAWALLILIALLSRSIGLGDRAMSHDESLHTVYSWKLFDGQGYQHQPMMHGPLKFHLVALSYFLFGVNDWSSRIEVALFGVALVGMAWMLRRWIGKTGAWLVGFMFAISPALLFYSRYIRDEVMLCAIMVFWVIAMFRYIETRKTIWFYLTAVALALAFITMEVSFIFGALFGGFLVAALAAELWGATWPDPSMRYPFRLVVSFAGPAIGAGVLFLVMRQIAPAMAFLQLGGLLLMGFGLLLAAVAAVMAVLGWRTELHHFPELDLIVLHATLVLPFLSAVVLTLLHWPIDQFNDASKVSLATVAQGGAVVILLLAVSAAVGWYWLRNKWFVAAGIFWAIDVLFFTTFLTNAQGLATGIVGSLGYWIPQQEVARGGQPWYYFWLLVPLYEFLPLLLSVGGTIAALQGKARRSDVAVAAAVPGDGHMERRAPALGAARVGDPAVAGEAAAARGLLDAKSLFVAFLVFWVAGTWLIFTYVGEKMPWHVTYFATSMSLLGGWWLGHVIDGIDWARVRARGGLWLIAMVPLLLVALKSAIPMSSHRPFASTTTAGISDTTQWLLALAVTLVLIYLIYDRAAALGRGLSLRLVALSLAALLAILTIGVSYRFAFINYDYATEPLVYAHGTPDLKLAMSQIEEISRKTKGDLSLKVAYDDDSTWPLLWYLRDYTNQAYYGATPSREALDAPVVIAGSKNVDKVRPYLGDKYYEFKYRLVWWPRETYKDLTWQRIWAGITDPVQRGQFWDVVIHRRYTTPTAQWEPQHPFSLFIRKDVAAQVWNWGAAPASGSAQTTDPYAAGEKTVTAIQQIGAAGVPGAAPGQFNLPRAIAVGPDGNLFVSDSGNNRIEEFSSQGTLVRQWGSTCNLLQKAQGCQGDGHGQFSEPWGVAVDKDGNVYVADTWNSRIQKFDKQGNFITMWGAFESVGADLGQGGGLYGPRGIAVGLDGNIYVADTGNKRIQEFKPDGSFVAQWGGQGIDPGRFDEPTDLVQDAQGNWYVADAWNQRIQKFDSSFKYLKSWNINGWASKLPAHKPYLAVDNAHGLLYASDPESYRVLVFNLDGQFKATFGLFGNDAQSFMLPTGLAVTADGNVYVADTDGSRVMLFPPVNDATASSAQ